MTHYTTNYAGMENGDRKAVNDCLAWLGLTRSKFAINALRSAQTMSDIDGVTFALEFSGVTGHPVRMLIQHVLGRDVLKYWLDTGAGDKTLINKVQGA